MRLAVGAALAWLLICTFPSAAGAAEIECLQRALDFNDVPFVKGYVPPPATSPQTMGTLVYSGESCAVAHLSGDIVAGDYDRFVAFYRENPMLESVFLQSDGGDVAEAIKIGRLLRQYLFTADAPKFADPSSSASFSFDLSGEFGQNATVQCSGTSFGCVSACALIWFGAVERDGDVALHRPTSHDPVFASLSADNAISSYHQELADITGYLSDMEAPQPIIDTMLATSSSDLTWVDADRDRLNEAPSYAEWMKTRCPPNSADTNPFSDLVCAGNLRRAEVAKMAPP